MLLIKKLLKATAVGIVAVLVHMLFAYLNLASHLSVLGYGCMVGVYAIVALQLLTLKENLKGNKLTIVMVVFMFFFVIDALMSTLEGNFFIENYSLWSHMGLGMIKSVAVVGSVFVLWKQDVEDVSFFEEAKSFFSSRTMISWLIRICVVLLISFVVYMIIGALAYPLTGPFMEAEIKIPSLFENFMIQVLRGLGYLLVTFPIMILWRDKKSLGRTLGFSYILFYPILGYAFTVTLPLTFRMLDATVLSLHMIVFTVLIMKLLRRNRG